MVKCKKVLCNMTSIVVLTLVLILGFVFNIYASEEAWSGTVSTPGSLIKTDPLKKTNNNSAWVKYTSGSSDFLRVYIYASKTKDGNYVDVTHYSTTPRIYQVYEGASSYMEVKNMAYEDYKTCYAKAYFVTTSAGAHVGFWKQQ